MKHVGMKADEEARLKSTGKNQRNKWHKFARYLVFLPGGKT